jgi:hypothetical protein
MSLSLGLGKPFLYAVGPHAVGMVHRDVAPRRPGRRTPPGPGPAATTGVPQRRRDVDAPMTGAVGRAGSLERVDDRAPAPIRPLRGNRSARLPSCGQIVASGFRRPMSTEVPGVPLPARTYLSGPPSPCSREFLNRVSEVRFLPGHQIQP